VKEPNDKLYEVKEIRTETVTSDKLSFEGESELTDKNCCARFSNLWRSSKARLSRAFWMLFHVGFSMFVTFIVFPGVTAATSLSFISSRAWFDLVMVSIFNVFDTIGRYVGGKL